MIMKGLLLVLLISSFMISTCVFCDPRSVVQDQVEEYPAAQQLYYYYYYGQVSTPSPPPPEEEPSSTPETTDETMAPTDSGEEPTTPEQTPDIQVGDATFYDLGQTACGPIFSDSDFVAAISPEWFTTPNPNEDPICGTTVVVTSSEFGTSTTVQIWDKCPGCAPGDIDLSPAAFGQLADLNLGRISVQWDFVQE